MGTLAVTAQPLDSITDRLMEVFRKDQNLIDILLPELTGEEAPAVFGHNKWVPVHKALRYMVIREFTTGVRRGSDALMAIGLGATAVFAGRPFVTALGVAGEAGVTRAFAILREELERSMALLGTSTLADVRRDHVLEGQSS